MANTQQMLAANIQNVETESQDHKTENHIEVSKQSLLSIHSQQLSNGINNDDNTLNIVSALGGIDIILTHILESDYHVLDKNKLTRLNQILTTPIKYQQKHKISTLTKINNNPNDNIGGFCYTFDENKTYLHLLFKNNLQIANRLIFLIRNKMVNIFMIIFILLWLITMYYLNVVAPTAALIVTLTNWFLLMPYTIIWVLSFNRNAFGLIIRCFEFWFKLFYATFTIILLFIYTFNMSDTNHNINSTYTILVIIVFIQWVITFGVSLLIISAGDAITLGSKFKIISATLQAISCTTLSVWYECFEDSKNDYVIYIPRTNSSISFQSIIASGFQIIAIFMWKQAIVTYFNNRKEKCVLIRYSPYIKWINILSTKSNQNSIKNEKQSNAKSKLAYSVNVDGDNKEIKTLVELKRRHSSSSGSDTDTP
eukprot:457146_1